MIGLQRCASRSESNRSVHLYKLASQRKTKALIRLCVSWITTQLILHLSLSTTKQTKWHVRAAKTQDSLADQSSCAAWVANGLCFRQSNSEDWPDWADAQADLSLHFAQRSFCCLVLRIILLLKRLRVSLHIIYMCALKLGRFFLSWNQARIIVAVLFL